jgi:hypothetical protein
MYCFDQAVCHQVSAHIVQRRSCIMRCCVIELLMQHTMQQLSDSHPVAAVSSCCIFSQACNISEVTESCLLADTRRLRLYWKKLQLHASGLQVHCTQNQVTRTHMASQCNSPC